jgi:hypothetical protein
MFAGIRPKESRHFGQMGARRESTSGSPQIRQSAGKIVLTSPSLTVVSQERSFSRRPRFVLAGFR